MYETIAPALKPYLAQHGMLWTEIIAQHRSAHPEQERLWQRYALFATNFVTTRLCQYVYIHESEVNSTAESVLHQRFESVIRAEINYLADRVKAGMIGK